MSGQDCTGDKSYKICVGSIISHDIDQIRVRTRFEWDGAEVTLPLAAALAFCGGMACAEDMPIFDAHVHYSHDAVDFVPPE